MTEVRLHIYDVTNSGSDKTNTTILQINKIFKDGIGLGGIFHSAVQVYGDDEWSFGFCEQGSGVFNCPSGQNPMYTYRESMVLGRTNFSKFKVNQILRELSREWPGSSYDLLSKNCNHFCDEFCERLGVQKLPGPWAMAGCILSGLNVFNKSQSEAFSFVIVISTYSGLLVLATFLTGWVNRFANAGDTAIEIAETTALRLRQAKTEIVSASKVAYRFLMGVNSGSDGGNDSPGNSNRGSRRFQAAWFKNLITTGARPSSSTEIETQDDNVLQQQRQQNYAETVRQNFQDSE